MGVPVNRNIVGQPARTVPALGTLMPEGVASMAGGSVAVAQRSDRADSWSIHNISTALGGPTQRMSACSNLVGRMAKRREHAGLWSNGSSGVVPGQPACATEVRQFGQRVRCHFLLAVGCGSHSGMLMPVHCDAGAVG